MRSTDHQKIIVVGLPKTLDDAKLTELFSDFGAVVEAKVVLDGASSTSRGFGFVTFAATSAMRAAIKGMHKKVVQGRTLNVRQLVPKEEFQSRKQEIPDASQRPCWLLRKGKCTKGANCPFSHTIADGNYGNCFEYLQTGECKHGAKCKFSHPPLVKGIDKAMSGDTMEAKVVNTRVCYSFQNGRCHRGKTCLYAHDLLVNGEKHETTKETNRIERAKSDVGTKRQRDESVKNERKMNEEPIVGDPKVARKRAKQAKHSSISVKPFEWKVKAQGKEVPHQDQMQSLEAQDDRELEDKLEPCPVIKSGRQRVDMGAAFDNVLNDGVSLACTGKAKKGDRAMMRANRARLKLDRRSKRIAKKTALTKLLTKGEVEL